MAGGPMTKTISVLPSDGGRIFIEYDSPSWRPYLRVCVVSDSSPATVGWVGFTLEDLGAFKNALDTVVLELRGR